MGVRNLVTKLRKQREELQVEYDRQHALDKTTTPGLDEVYDLMFYFDPFDYQSQKAYAILNYYKVSFQRVGHNDEELQQLHD